MIFIEESFRLKQNHPAKLTRIQKNMKPVVRSPIVTQLMLPSIVNCNDDSTPKHSVISNLKTSPRHDLAIIFTCKVCETRSFKTVCRESYEKGKVCETRSFKTVCRESYEKGVVVAQCGGCNDLHLIADCLGWFVETGSVEDLLAACGEEVKKVLLIH